MRYFFAFWQSSLLEVVLTFGWQTRDTRYGVWYKKSKADNDLIPYKLFLFLNKQQIAQNQQHVLIFLFHKSSLVVVAFFVFKPAD